MGDDLATRLATLEVRDTHREKQIDGLLTLTARLIEMESRRQGREEAAVVASERSARTTHEVNSWGRTVAAFLFVGAGTLLAHGLIAFVNSGVVP